MTPSTGLMICGYVCCFMDGLRSRREGIVTCKKSAFSVLQKTAFYTDLIQILRRIFIRVKILPTIPIGILIRLHTRPRTAIGTGTLGTRCTLFLPKSQWLAIFTFHVRLPRNASFIHVQWLSLAVISRHETDDIIEKRIGHQSTGIQSNTSQLH